MSYYSAQVVFIITLFTWAILRSICLIDSSLLQMEVSALSPRVAFLDHQRSLLTVGNSHLKQRIAALAQDKIFKDGIQILLFSLVRIYLVLNMLVRLDLNWYQICNMQCSSSRGTEEGDRAATPTVPAAADQGHHRRRRHRYCRLDAGQARAARVRGRCHPIAEVIVDRCNTCQLALCWFFWGAVHRVERHTC